MTPSEGDWLKGLGESEPSQIMTSFVALPRFVGKRTVSYHPSSNGLLFADHPSFNVDQWSIVRLLRVWLLLRLCSTTNAIAAIKNIETLFDTAELNELVALFSSLSLLPSPNVWLPRATDAVRSNMGDVFDAIALANPYPKVYFPESAWNQLVLKTIFNAKPLHYIDGLMERRNLDLARSVSDLIEERWSAGRSIPYLAWSLLAPFVNESIILKLNRLMESGDPSQAQVVALVCYESSFPSAKDLLLKLPKQKNEILSGKLSWSNFQESN